MSNDDQLKELVAGSYMVSAERIMGTMREGLRIHEKSGDFPSVRRGHRLVVFGIKLAVALMLFALGPRGRSAPNIITGSAMTSANFDSSPSLSIAPAGPGSPGNFLQTSAVPFPGTGSLGSNGWSTANWTLALSNTSHLMASGSTVEGFNGFFGQNGYLYGWGVSQFSATIHLDQDYSYSVNSSGFNVSGIWGNTGAQGFLRAGNHTISGSSYGGTEPALFTLKSGNSFNFDFTLTPVTSVPTAAEVLSSLSLTPTIANKLDANGHMTLRKYITFDLTSTLNLPMGDLAHLLGVDHFNFYSQIVDAPESWQIKDGNSILKPNGQSMTALHLSIDDPPHGGVTRSIFNATTGVGGNVHAYTFDNNPSYLNDSDATSSGTMNATTFQFYDSPSLVKGMFSPYIDPFTGRYEECEKFYTQLVGVDANGNIVTKLGDTNGLGYTWKSNQMTGDLVGDIWQLTPPNATDLPNVESGDIFDVQAAPEPNVFVLEIVAVAFLAMGRSRKHPRSD
ncbi:MAG: hypothetical protein QOE70_1642 [Chthoniobacter sp.]|jgi:hypothetical protein|nr:hypothetical protein [Chthoniobacter sp.]